MDTLDYLNTIEKKLCNKASLKKIPLIGTIELLPLCNMDCEMCYIRLSKDEMNNSGKLKAVDEWISLAKDMKSAGTLFVLLTGGEPFLYKDFEKLYDELRNLGMIVSINTNGTLINEKIANMLQKNKPRRVNITLYGASNETYERVCHNKTGYDETIKGIELLKDRNIDVKINVSLVKENMMDLPKILQIAKELEVPIKVDTYMYPKTKGIKSAFNYNSRVDPKEVAKIEKFIKFNTEPEELFNRNMTEYLYEYEYVKNNKSVESLKHRCQAGNSSYYINWQGVMSPCVFLDNIREDIFSNGFYKSWDSIVKQCNDLFFPIKCNTCNNRGVCQICVASAYCETGSFNDAPEYLCEITNEFIELLK